MIGASLVSVLEITGGVVFGYLISAWFARRNSRELRQLVTVLALYMKRDGLLEDVELDEHGNLKGYIQTIYVPFIDDLDETVYPPTVTQDPPPPEDGRGSDDEKNPES